MDKVSIIVRTCGRPEVLRGALESIRKQTYPDVETVVIEDGLEISLQMICTEYSDLQSKIYFNREKSWTCKSWKIWV